MSDADDINSISGIRLDSNIDTSDIRLESSTGVIRIEESDDWACGDSMPPAKPFCYETDVTISANGQEYTVERLREISDEEFDQVRKAVYAGVGQLAEIGGSNRFGVVVLPAISSAIDTIERLALDRRIKRLEERLG